MDTNTRAFPHNGVLHQLEHGNKYHYSKLTYKLVNDYLNNLVATEKKPQPHYPKLLVGKFGAFYWDVTLTIMRALPSSTKTFYKGFTRLQKMHQYISIGYHYSPLKILAVDTGKGIKYDVTYKTKPICSTYETEALRDCLIHYIKKL